MHLNGKGVISYSEHYWSDFYIFQTCTKLNKTHGRCECFSENHGHVDGISACSKMFASPAAAIWNVNVDKRNIKNWLNDYCELDAPGWFWCSKGWKYELPHRSIYVFCISSYGASKNLWTWMAEDW